MALSKWQFKGLARAVLGSLAAVVRAGPTWALKGARSILLLASVLQAASSQVNRSPAHAQDNIAAKSGPRALLDNDVDSIRNKRANDQAAA